MTRRSNRKRKPRAELKKIFLEELALQWPDASRKKRRLISELLEFVDNCDGADLLELFADTIDGVPRPLLPGRLGKVYRTLTVEDLDEIDGPEGRILFGLIPSKTGP